MKLKHGDYILCEGCIGQVSNALVNQGCYTVQWLYNPNKQHYYQPKSLYGKCEVLPKDVAENLLEVLNKNG